MIAHDLTNCVLSKHALSCIKARTPYSLHSIQTASHGWFIGYGQQAWALPGMTITRHQAESLLRSDLMHCEMIVRNSVTKPMRDSQYDALVSHCFLLSPNKFRASAVLCDVEHLSAAAVSNAFNEDLPDARFPTDMAKLAIAEQRLWWSL